MKPFRIELSFSEEKGVPSYTAIIRSGESAPRVMAGSLPKNESGEPDESLVMALWANASLLIGTILHTDVLRSAGRLKE